MISLKLVFILKKYSSIAKDKIINSTQNQLKLQGRKDKSQQYYNPYHRLNLELKRCRSNRIQRNSVKKEVVGMGV